MKQKLLLSLFALLLPVAASAYDACIDGIYYNVVKKAKQATVTYGNSESGTYTGKVVIPEKILYDGIICDVVGIGTSAFKNCALSFLFLPNSITKSEKNSFGTYSEKAVIDTLCIADLASWCNIEFGNEYSSPFRYTSFFYLNKEKITDLILPDGVKSVGNYAFYDAVMLTSVKLPDSVESIGSYAFYSCLGLSSVTWGKGITSVGERAFHDCKNIERVNISDLKAWLSVDFGISHLKVSSIMATFDYIQNPLYYAGHLYLNDKELTDVVVPDGVETLSSHAFEGYTAMTSLVIPDGVKKINSRLDADATTFLARGFYGIAGCPNLKSVKIGTGLKEMDISGCAALTTLEVGDSKMSLYISSCSSLTEDGIKIVNANSVSISNCAAITELTPTSVIAQSISVSECSGLKKLQIPDATSRFGVGSCENLATLVLGRSLARLDVSHCKELTDVYNPSLFPLNEASFSDDCLIEYVTLHVPEDALDTYKNDEKWGKFGTIVALKEGDPGYEDINPDVNTIVFVDQQVEQICLEHWDTDGDGKLSLEEAAAVKDLGTVFKGTKITTFNELKYFTGLTAIGDNAFNSCNMLQSITIPDGIKTVGHDAFYWCASLPSIKWPDSVTELGDYVFAFCYSFTSLNLPQGVTKIPSFAYYGCSGIEEIHIPDHITEIGSNVFWGAKGRKLTFTKMYIPSSVKKIGSRIFDESSVEEIHVSDIDNWLNMEIGSIGSPYRLFANGSEVKEVAIPQSVKKIGWSQFWGCTSLTSLTIPEWVTEIGLCAFEDCTALTSLVFSGKVYINQEAFSGCQGLQDIYCPITNPNDIGLGYGGVKGIFKGVLSTATLHVPAESVETYKSDAQWKNFANIVALQEGEPGYQKPEENVTVTAKSYNRAYGEANPAFEYTLEGGALKGTPEINCQATASSKPGDYPITITKGSVTNKKVTFVNGTLTVTKAPLTITAKSYTIKQGEPLPSFEVTYSGFKNGESKSVLTKQPTVSCAATSNSEPGMYDIIVSGATADNYEITHVKGTLRIRSLVAEPGDLNDDGEIDVTDVVELIDMVLSGSNDPAGDINGDGEVDVTDVVELIDIVLSGE